MENEHQGQALTRIAVILGMSVLGTAVAGVGAVALTVMSGAFLDISRHGFAVMLLISGIVMALSTWLSLRESGDPSENWPPRGYVGILLAECRRGRVSPRLLSAWILVLTTSVSIGLLS